MFSNRPGSEHLSERMNTNTGLFVIHTHARAFSLSFPPLIGCGWKKRRSDFPPCAAPILPPNDKSLQMWWAGARLCLCVIAKCQQALEKGSLEHTTTCLTFRPKLTPGARLGLRRLMSGFGADGTGTAVTLNIIFLSHIISQNLGNFNLPTCDSVRCIRLPIMAQTCREDGCGHSGVPSQI